METYVVTARIVGSKVLNPGDTVQLTREQAQEQLWKSRVRPADSGSAQAGSEVDAAKAEAEMFMEEARRKFCELREDAKAEAERIIEDAKAEAERIKAQAVGQGGVLTVNPADRKEQIKAKLTELGIEFDGRQGEAALFKLLPKEEQDKLGE